MNLNNFAYRALRRLGIQPFLNWHHRIADPGVIIPFLGEPLGSAAMLDGEPWRIELFGVLHRWCPFDQVLDVGANEGQTLIDLCRAGLSGVGGYAFEPGLACAYYLQKLIEANDWRNISLFPIALSDSESCRLLEMDSENSAGASTVPNLRPGLPISLRPTVPCFRLDFLVTTGAVVPRSNFLLKIDVEGAELDVIRGSISTLVEHRPLVVCEVLWAHCADRIDFMGERNAALMDLLVRSDYEVFRLVLSPGDRSLRGLEAMKAFPSGVYSPANAHECEYLFAPRELAARLGAHLSLSGARSS